ncbi:MAG: hypothetical protein JXR13_15025 [Thalassovita sp.]
MTTKTTKSAAATSQEIQSLDAVKADVEAIGDTNDGLDLRSYKRQAIASLDTARNNVMALLKLSA